MNLEGKMCAYALEVLDSYKQGYVDQETFDFQQTMVRIGNIVFTSSIFESFSEIGMRIDSLCPDMKVLSLSNTNGSKSYFATEDQLCLGGYEVSMYLYGGIQPYCAHADWEMIRQCAGNVKAMTEGK